MDPNIIFEEKGQYALGVYDGRSRASAGVDDTMGMVAMTALRIVGPPD
jgi:hypothetical protein